MTDNPAAAGTGLRPYRVRIRTHLDNPIRCGKAGCASASLLQQKWQQRSSLSAAGL